MVSMVAFEADDLISILDWIKYVILIANSNYKPSRSDKNGEAWYRSRYISYAKWALYYLSKSPINAIEIEHISYLLAHFRKLP